MACLLKYPVFADPSQHHFRKFGLFDAERAIAADVWHHTGLAEGVRHPLVYVLEACDDIAYSVIDAEDIVKKRYASFNDLIDHLRSANNDPVTKDVIELAIKKNRDFRHERLSSAELDDLTMQMFRAKAIAEMVESATDTFRANVSPMMAGSIDPTFELLHSSKCGVLCDSLKKFDYAHGYQNPSVLRLELQGDTYIRETMDLLWEGITGHVAENPFAHYAYGRISENYRRIYEDGDQNHHDKAHLLCDAVSGMTEQFLVSLHRDLEDTERMTRTATKPGDLSKRVKRFLSRERDSDRVLSRLLDCLDSLHDSYLFGGVLRDIALFGISRLESDIDLVSEASRDQFARWLRRTVSNSRGIGSTVFGSKLNTGPWTFGAPRIPGPFGKEVVDTTALNRF